jgi:hypothetical protein
VFDQYLRTTRLPEFEYATYGGVLRYRWGNVVRGFAMPVRVSLVPHQPVVLVPTGQWQSMRLPRGAADTVVVDPNYYVTTWRLDAPPRCTIVCRN